jgi:Tfp pilus assembly protein PilF
MKRLSGKILILALIINQFMTGGCDRQKNKSQSVETKEDLAYDSAAVERSKSIISSRTLGLAYLEDNRLEEAEAEFLKLIELAPEEALGYANLGIVYMRMGNYEQSEKQLKKAVEINPDDPDIRLNLAKVYDLLNKEEASREELEKTIEIDPDHVQSLYSLAESYQNQADEYSVNQWEKYLQKIVDTSPTNLVARIYLAEVLIKTEDGEEALKNLEEIERISPAFPAEAEQYFQQAVIRIRTDSLVEALTSVRIFHNMIKLSNAYQTDIQELKGTTASQVGVPVISFSEVTPGFLMEGESLIDVIRFTDVTTSAGLDVAENLESTEFEGESVLTKVTSGDMDRDGDQDIYVSGFNPNIGKYTHYLLKNEMGRFKDVAIRAGLVHDGIEQDAIFSDYNNDGFLDLYIAKQGPNLLYENVSEDKFEEISARARVNFEDKGHLVLFFDMDQEGDLDLFLGNQNSISIFQNNGDGTFLDKTGKIAMGDQNSGCLDAVFGDYDDDGDVDLILLKENGLPQLYFNLRDGNFSNETGNSGLWDIGKVTSLASGDYNNDGFEDLFLVRENQSPILLKNMQDGSFLTDDPANDIFKDLEDVNGYDALMFDFDNDGFLDILFVGEKSSGTGRGVFMFHNNGSGNFSDASFVLPDDLHEGHQAIVTDYNEDGDLDILITGKNYGIRLLRNDGGNANHHLRVQLVGIRTGSGKNNHYGIGAKIEMRAGDLYQMKTVTEPNIHFGLGNREKVDVVRILWTNGVPQNIFSPGSDQDLIEEQELKGSCPFLYVWDGERFEFHKDMMWRSALGMPMGIMGGNKTFAFPDASKEYLKIPGEALRSKDHKYHIQITAELWETIYFDHLNILAIDHPADVDVFVNERFTGPPFEELSIYQVKDKKLPISIKDGYGIDQKSLVESKDNKYITNFKREKFQGLTEMHDLDIDFGEIDPRKNLYLFLNGWIFPTDASINVSLSQNASYQVKPPLLQAINSDGQWITIIEDIGFPSGKDKTLVVNLSGKLPDPANPKIRIRTNMEIYWDHIFYSNESVDVETVSNSLNLDEADLHYRGFSATYRKGGRYGPFWFDYSRVTKKPKWRDLRGKYTKYGDVKSLLQEAESQYVVMNAGDELSISFNACNLPDVRPGWERDYIVYSVGWVKDGDLNTAKGNQAGPYPYHGMAEYPYSKGSTNLLPDNFLEYFNAYNTRVVGNEAFKNEIRNYKQ